MGLDVQLTAVEELPPDAAARLEIVPIQIGWRQPQELVVHRAVLRKHYSVHLRHTLMPKDVVEELLFVRLHVPPDGLVEHHEEKTIQRL